VDFSQRGDSFFDPVRRACGRRDTARTPSLPFKANRRCHGQLRAARCLPTAHAQSWCALPASGCGRPMPLPSPARWCCPRPPHLTVVRAPPCFGRFESADVLLSAWSALAVPGGQRLFDRWGTASSSSIYCQQARPSLPRWQSAVGGAAVLCRQA